MTAASRLVTENANLGPASSCTPNESNLQANWSVMRALQAFYRARNMKPLDEIRAALTPPGHKKAMASDRMIQYWLANKYSIGAEELAVLLRTDAGFAVLEELMGTAKPTWWKDFKRSIARAQVRREQALLAKRIAEIDQGELDL